MKFRKYYKGWKSSQKMRKFTPTWADLEQGFLMIKLLNK